MRLLFHRQPHVYLPELSAYKRYLAAHFPHVEVYESTDLDGASPQEFDIHWHFMGVDTKRRKGVRVVHEYNSLSTAPFAGVKDRIKRMVNTKPDARVFLNSRVERAFGFRDALPSHTRDMGIDPAYFDVSCAAPRYDFIMAGGLGRGSVIDDFLEHLCMHMGGVTALLVGDAPEALRARFKDHKNIAFHGRAEYANMPALMAEARYGLNLMPDIAPFNVQTATKVLEYAAAGMPVISTDYQWIKEYESTFDASVFKLSDDMTNLSMDALADFAFKTPDLSHLKWDTVIKESGIFDFLNA